MPLPTGKEASYKDKLKPGDRQIYNSFINAEVKELQQSSLLTWSQVPEQKQEEVINRIKNRLRDQDFLEATSDDVRKSMINKLKGQKYEGTASANRAENRAKKNVSTGAATTAPTGKLPYDPIRDASPQQDN
ncbi:hypothetical protein COCCADRAFT_31287 [Bipolaris zeicola 26-R-13]|uniref:Uncharacterized protein n=1 Tax=Cochliobolus carbonum (strain 26-R-13) TaxID=930089 RepID=W6XJ72_COCC2|nr:uncharacterized protein COCCADRAFT_31287 [Bipolaris zeicola 26-R-13]EUC27157.1 hypothetical protein COCCADRAFT_31287 [Bipolaris zeicola 26-R-13]